MDQIAICPICYESYNLNNRRPRLLPTCGHTLCSDCLTKLINQPEELRCPIDKGVISTPEGAINHDNFFKLNYALIQILESTHDKKLCPNHNEELRFVCMTDKMKLCDSCMCEGKHQNHKIVPLAQLYNQANSTKMEVEKVLKELDHLKAEITKSLEDNQKRYIMMIRELFEEYRKIIYQKELDLCFEINYFYDKEKDRVNDIIGLESAFRKKINIRKTELDNIRERDNFLEDNKFFSNIKEEAQSWTSMVNPGKLKQNIEEIEKKLEGMFSEFHSGFLNNVRACCNISFSFPDSVDCIVQAFSELDLESKTQTGTTPREPVFQHTPEKYLNFYTKNNFEYFKVKLESNLTPFSIKSKFNFEVTVNSSNSKVLNISTSSTLKSTNIELEKWATVQIVRLEFNEAHIDDQDIAVLSYIWRRIDRPPYLQIKVSRNSIKECYKDVCKALLEGSKGYTSVVIDLAQYQLVNKDLVQYLVDDLLSRMTFLKEIRLIMNDINLKSRSQGGLFQGIKLNAANLQYFSLKLSNSNIVDEDIAPIFVAMPNIRKYFLDFESTKVTDITLDNYVQNTMPYRKNLEIYVLNLNYTKVTHAGLKGLFANPITVKHFQFFIANTEANDQTVSCLLESIKDSFNIFEIFSVNFSYCRMMSDTAICQMFQQMSKVKTYTLGLSNTQITDASLAQFAKRSLSTMKALENFAISLDETPVTDAGANHIMSELAPNLKQLVISLHHTAVTNKSIEPFVKTTLAAMKSLKGFKMNVTETGVTAEIKADIEKLEKTIKDKTA